MIDFPQNLIRKRQLDGLKAASLTIKAEDELQWGLFSTITTDIKKLEEASVMIEDF